MEQVLKRLKSFFWRFGAALFVGLLALLVSPDFKDALLQDGVRIPVSAWLLITLVVGEITKYLNTPRS